MASLLQRMNITADDSTGPVRSRPSHGRSSGPYNRPHKTPKGDVDSPWSHDLFESHNSLSARLSNQPTVPKANLNAIAQKALREATGSRSDSGLAIKGAGNSSQGNVVEITGLVAGTTADDVSAIFKRCGTITNAKSISKGNDTCVRVTFKSASSAATAVQKFHNQPADGQVLSVKIVGTSSAGTSLGGRLGGADGLGLVREEGSVDILMDADGSGSKMRSDLLLKEDPRAQVLVAPPGTNPADYMQTHENNRGFRRGGGRGRGSRRGRRGGHGGEGRMEID